MSLLGLYLAACAVLAVAGAAKVMRPAALATALGSVISAPTRVLRAGVRVLAAVELVVALAGLVAPATAALAVALSYSGFAIYVTWLRGRSGAIASCGCFGTPDTPATRLHVAITASFAVASWIVAATVGGDGLIALLGASPGDGVPLVLASASVALLAIVGLTSHASLQASRSLYAP